MTVWLRGTRPCTWLWRPDPPSGGKPAHRREPPVIPPVMALTVIALSCSVGPMFAWVRPAAGASGGLVADFYIEREKVMVRKSRGRTAVVIGACAGFLMALGAASDLKYMSFVAAGTSGPSENPNVDGVCKVKFDATTSTTRLHLSV